MYFEDENYHVVGVAKQPRDETYAVERSIVKRQASEEKDFYYLKPVYSHQHKERNMNQKDKKVMDIIKTNMILLDRRSENIDFIASYESYCEDKKNIFLCTRDEDDNLYDINSLMYVAMHELSHALCPFHDPDHKTKEFWSIFGVLKSKAKNLKLWDENFIFAKNYCKKSK